jgi:predicted component of type VI protein secretion system
MEPPTLTERSIRFRIEAHLDVDPVPEPIVFDTVLKLGSSDFDVKEN